MAEAVVEIVLEKFISFAGREVGLFLGFNQEKKKLESMFSAIKATLQDAEEKQFSQEGAGIKDWLRKIKDETYKLDDILDECAYEVLRLEYQGDKFCLHDKVQCSCLSFFDPKHVVFRYKIAKKMKRISERLKEIYDERTQFHLTDLTVQKRTSGVLEWRQTMSSIIEPHVYGREEDTKRIVDSLIDYADESHSESQNLLVYPIVGQGGLGKTTLAQLIYKDERVVKCFEPRMWVCVSTDFSCKRMIKAIIKEASGKDCEDSDLEPLQKKLQDQLRSKRYLLVLDDVWDDKPDNWQKLRSVLNCGAKGATILVTTRLLKVVEIMGTMKDVGELSTLSDNDCWELFKCQAFGPNEPEQVELVDIGKEIVNKCGGVPLAAKALGAFLRFERKEKAWLNVLKSNIWSLKDNIMPALRLSYLNLPVKLRPCFAYCAIFPKDEKIEKQYLIELWMANGFISSEGRLDAEDVGDGVWRELYWRSFFQEIERDEIGQVTSFKMHDLVHDLAQSIAQDVCCITDDNDETTMPEPETIRHISYDSWSEPDESIYLMHQVKSLRTYIREPNGRIDQLSAQILKCYSLRVLRCGIEKELSSSIGDLKHLRYLNLSYSSFETLPESLGKLWNLMILKLDHCGNLQRLPNSLIQLKALQQLSFKSSWYVSSLPPQIGKLTSLMNLSKYIVGKEEGFLLSELGPLKLKGDFCIENLEKVKKVEDAKEANMSIKQLNELDLSWNGNEECELQENVEEILQVLQPDTQHLKSLSVVGYEGVNFPQWVSSPSIESLKLWDLPNLIRLPREDGENMLPRLSSFQIIDCPEFLAEEVLVQGMHSLKRLQIIGFNKFNVSVNFQFLTCLEDLCIGDWEEVEGLDEAVQHMTALKKLTLMRLPNLESLPDCFGSLPMLENLDITSCESLRCLPTSLSLLTSLKRLSIWGCPDLKKRCEKQTGEDWPKIAHIPHIMMNGDVLK